MMHIKQEPLSTAWEDILLLLPAHWDEVVGDKLHGHLNPDLTVYSQIEDADRLVLVTVRDNDILIGYVSFFISSHPHSKDTVVALNDAMYLKPKYRGRKIATDMIHHAESCLFYRGVNQMLLSVGHNTPAESFAEVSGFKPYEVTYSKIIGDK